MPRYFFRLTDGREVLNPHEGIELPGHAAAREEASRFARSIRQGRTLAGRKWDDWFIRILDAHGNEIDTVPINAVPDDSELP